MFIELLHSCQATQHLVSKLCLHLTIIIILFLRVFFGINPERGSKFCVRVLWAFLHERRVAAL